MKLVRAAGRPSLPRLVSQATRGRAAVAPSTAGNASGYRYLIPRTGSDERRGAATVELAVLLPFLAALILFAIDFARIFDVTITLENSIHNAALFASQVFDNQNQQWIGDQQYWEGPNGELISLPKVAAKLDGSNLSPGLADADISVAPGTDADGHAVRIVTVSYTFTTLVPYPGIPSPLTITRTAQVRVAPATPGPY
jgi:TadE-like protein